MFEILIAAVVSIVWSAAIGLLGVAGNAHAREQEKIEFLMKRYQCDRSAATELLAHIRRAKAHTIFEGSGLTL
jgi:hypothetical protein